MARPLLIALTLMAGAAWAAPVPVTLRVRGQRDRHADAGNVHDGVACSRTCRVIGPCDVAALNSATLRGTSPCGTSCVASGDGGMLGVCAND